MSAHLHNRGGITQLDQEVYPYFLLTLNCVFENGDHAEGWDADCILCDANICARMNHAEALQAAEEHECEEPK